MTDWASVLDDLPLEADEAIRWLYRHHVCLDFDVDENGRDVVRLGVPLRHPEGDVHQARASVPSPERALATALELIATTREVLNLE